MEKRERERERKRRVIQIKFCFWQGKLETDAFDAFQSIFQCLGKYLENNLTQTLINECIFKYLKNKCPYDLKNDNTDGHKLQLFAC